MKRNVFVGSSTCDHSDLVRDDSDAARMVLLAIKESLKIEEE